MLQNSYIHIPYVGYITEKKIWASGAKDWNSFDADKVNFPYFRKAHIKKFVELSIECLKNGNYSFFSSLMPKHEHWRCLKDFTKIAYLEIKDYISSFPLIVTFNGSSFDLPFISSKLGIKFEQLHVDLRFAFSRLGITGGLKRIEKMFELERSPETSNLDGLDAVHLWHKYVNGDDNALELLKKYNSEDVIGLKILSNRAYGMLKERLVG